MRFACVKITDNPNAKAGGATHTEIGHIIRDLKTERRGNFVFCVFTVTKMDSWGGYGWASGYFTKVKNFMPP
jgi:hypothetical protein